MNRPLTFLLISLLYISCGKSFEKNFLLQRSSSDLENSEIAYLGTYEYTKEIGEISMPEIIEYVGQRRMYSIFRNELEYKYKTPIDVSKEFSEEEMAIETLHKGILNFKGNAASDSIPGFPNFFQQINEYDQYRFGIISFVKRSSRASFHSDLYSNNKKYKVDFSSMVIDFEKEEVFLLYKYSKVSDYFEDKYELLFRALTLSISDEPYIEARSLNAIANWDERMVRVTFKDGGLFYGIIDYDYKHGVSLETADGTINKKLEDLLLVYDVSTESQLFPVFVEKFN